MKNSKFKIQNFKFLVVVLIFTFYILNFIGCATIIEGAKGFAGISTKTLEKGRKTAIAKTFNYDYFTCYNKTLDILKKIDAHIYTQDIKKRMIAIYISQDDTTPVGLFFKEIEANTTQVEVSSPSIYAKERIAKRVFAMLEGLPDPEKKEAKEEEQKQ